MCAFGEEPGPSTRNPAANDSLVGIVATHSLVSRAGLIPASLARDRPGILCRTVKDGATVLTAVAGYDPRDAATAASVGQSSDRSYQTFADDASLKGVRIGVVREFSPSPRLLPHDVDRHRGIVLRSHKIWMGLRAVPADFPTSVNTRPEDFSDISGAARIAKVRFFDSCQ
jgi:Asp-tRNA(Asn)/Glu-tRNA(Gln) amidotransferase A subunit family amidase